MRGSAWELRVCGVVLATHETPGIAREIRRRAVRPGWYTLDLWETSRFARSPEGAEHRDAPRRCLEVVDAYRRGEVTREQLIQARADASYASYAADAADASAAYAAASSASAAYASAYPAYPAAAYDYAAAHASASVAYAVADADAYAYARQMWHDDWTWHLIRHVLKDTGR